MGNSHAATAHITHRGQMKDALRVFMIFLCFIIMRSFLDRFVSNEVYLRSPLSVVCINRCLNAEWIQFSAGNDVNSLGEFSIIV